MHQVEEDVFFWPNISMSEVWHYYHQTLHIFLFKSLFWNKFTITRFPPLCWLRPKIPSGFSISVSISPIQSSSKERNSCFACLQFFFYHVSPIKSSKENNWYLLVEFNFWAVMARLLAGRLFLLKENTIHFLTFIIL